MGRTRVVHCQKSQFDVLIDRRTKWGNPFILGKDGDRDEVCDKHEEYIRNGEGKWLLDHLDELEDKVLGCHCKPSRCHGDTLVKLVEEFCGN